MCHNKPLFWTTSIVLALCHVDGFSAEDYRVVVSRAAAKTVSSKTKNSVEADLGKTKDVQLKATDTKTTLSGTVRAAKYVTCAAGKYLPAGADACKDCRADHACQGGKWTPDPSMDQGIIKCAAGKVNSKRTACLDSGSVKCNAGEYLPKGSTTCKECKADSKYYCPGGNYTAAPSYDMGIKTCPSNRHVNSSKSACLSGSAKSSGSINCSAGTYLPKGSTTCEACKADSKYYCPGGNYTAAPSYDMGIKTCPSNRHVNSSKSACLSGADGSGTQHCKEGKYLPANAKNCKECKSGYACSGGDWTVGFSKDQGIEKCDINKGDVPNSAKSKCKKKVVHLDAGYYLPAKSLTATKCDGDGNICPGDADYKFSSKEQGRQKCGENEAPNEAKTACVVIAAECKKGYWLPANATSCEKCSGTNSYCPGGKFGIEDKDQGKKECPPSFSTNSTQSGCSIKVTQRVMYNSSISEDLKLEDQCWQMEDTAKYIQCVLGDIDKYK